MWPGGSVWVGRNSGRTTAHAHHAIQVTVCLEEGETILFRPGSEPNWRSYRAAIIRPHRAHAFDGCGRAVAHVFVEPETDLGRTLAGKLGGSDIGGVEGDATSVARELSAAWRAADDLRILEAGRRLASSIAGALPPRDGPSPKIARALAFISRNLPASASLSKVADSVGVSPSRLRHLFVSETGATYRGYVLWLRINRAVAITMAGKTWTDAAHEAGFTDSAHLSRTFRRVFGVSPAMVVHEDRHG